MFTVRDLKEAYNLGWTDRDEAQPALDTTAALGGSANHQLDIDALTAIISALDTKLKICTTALEQIADEDFRGPRPKSAVIAYETLKKVNNTP